jgi:hypothetical protein
MLVITGLLDPRFLVEIEVDAIVVDPPPSPYGAADDGVEPSAAS